MERRHFDCPEDGGSELLRNVGDEDIQPTRRHIAEKISLRQQKKKKKVPKLQHPKWSYRDTMF